MCFVNDNGESTPPMLVSNLVQNEGKFLHCRNYDFLSARKKFTEPFGLLSMPHYGRHLRELPDSISDLLIKNPPISHDND